MIRPKADLTWIRQWGFGHWWRVVFEHRLLSFCFFKWYGWPVRALGWFIHDTRRRLEGARRVEQGPTTGCVYDDGLEIEFGGMCPVQGEGIVDGRTCYYRSRGDGWQFHVATADGTDALEHEEWEYAEYKYIWPAGGYVAASVSEACIRKAVALWRAK
jgi:hypothetical protein